MGRKRKSISDSLRFSILHRDHFQCVYCGKKIKHGVKFEIDHIYPFASGGDNDPTNLVTACKECNQGKRDRHLSDADLASYKEDAIKRGQEQSESDMLQKRRKWEQKIKERKEQEQSKEETRKEIERKEIERVANEARKREIEQERRKQIEKTRQQEQINSQSILSEQNRKRLEEQVREQQKRAAEFWDNTFPKCLLATIITLFLATMIYLYFVVMSIPAE